MRTIAIEEHFQAAGLNELLETSTPGLKRETSGAYVTALQAKLLDLGSTRLEDMDATGIDFQVLSHVASATPLLSGDQGVKLAQEANDQLFGATSAHPDRLAGLAVLPMGDPEASVAELERSVLQLGFKGVIVNGTTQGRFLDDPSFLPILTRAVDLDVPVYIHPGVPPVVVQEAYYTGFAPAISFALATGGWGWHSETAIHALRLILSGVFDRLPGLQIIIGHMGEMIPFMFDRIDTVFGRQATNLQRRVPEYFLRNFFITTSGFFTEPPFLLTLQVMGIDRILFSVDYPYSSNEQGRVFLDNLSLSLEDKKKLSHLNAERLLKLPQAR